MYNYIMFEQFKNIDELIKETILNNINNSFITKEVNEQYITVKDLDKIKIEDVVLGGLIAEMGYPSFNIEAYKAQAIAIRTFIKTNKKHEGEGFDLCGTTCCFVIADEEKKKKFSFEQLERFKKAVKETEGQLIYYNDEPIKTPVFFSYGHKTTNLPSDVWNGNDEKYPYLKRVETLENIKPQVKEYDKKHFFGVLGVKNMSDIKINEINSNGYVKEIEINGIKYKGNELRSKLEIKSGNFTIEEEGNKIKLTCYGYGHGVGMSQHGANIMAINGANYIDILTHYYKDVKIK